ncbi:MAG: hypothetical protein BGO54_16830 [Sphingobacteriales bacterium 46-32]|nr:MAG: hypothetical protein BGO54_16830 [Sphingobacteriales bacterium 46-32]
MASEHEYSRFKDNLIDIILCVSFLAFSAGYIYGRITVVGCEEDHKKMPFDNKNAQIQVR